MDDIFVILLAMLAIALPALIGVAWLSVIDCRRSVSRARVRYRLLTLVTDSHPGVKHTLPLKMYKPSIYDVRDVLFHLTEAGGTETKAPAHVHGVIVKDMTAEDLKAFDRAVLEGRN